MTLINVDSTIHEGAISAREAAKLLGVKKETLYAYASRGWLRSVAGAKGKERLYLRADVERLRARSEARSGHAAVARAALDWGEPVLDSALTGIDARGPRYRGFLATDLAKDGATFEEVAELLWSGTKPVERPSWTPLRAPKAKRLAALLPDAAPPLTVLSLLVPAMGAADDARFGASRETELARARGLIARLSMSLGGVRDDAEFTGVAASAVASLGARSSRAAVRAVDEALLLLADHELNVSSFTARVVASSGADLYACMAAALGGLSGPRHGGHCDRVEALVEEVRDPERAAEVVASRARRGEMLPGFGHKLYAEGDPRTPPLLARAEELAPRSHALRVVLAIVHEAAKQRGEKPTVDLGLVALCAALGAPPGSAAGLFALGRTAGWVAHVLEQREAGFMLRPRARYVGALRLRTICVT